MAPGRAALPQQISALHPARRREVWIAEVRISHFTDVIPPFAGRIVSRPSVLFRTLYGNIYCARGTENAREVMIVRGKDMTIGAWWALPVSTRR